MNLATTLRLFADAAGTGSEPADSHVTDEKTKKDSLRKNANAYDKLRRRVGPYGEDRNAKRKPLNPLRRKGLKAKNSLDPADDLDTERLSRLKKKQQRLCTVCTPGVMPGRNITGGKRK